MNVLNRGLLSACLLLGSLGVDAQVYKCMEGGKAVFTDKPCSADSAALRMPVAQPSEADLAAAAKRRRADAAKLQQIDAENEAARSKRAREGAQVEYARARKDSECAELSRRSKDDGSRGEEAKAQYFSRCYGSNRY